MKIINITQHEPTEDQKASNVFVDTGDEIKQEIKNLLNFSTMPNKGEIAERAKKIAKIAHGSGATHALMGGLLT